MTRSILIIDDDSQIRALLQMMIEMEGLRSDTAANAAEGLRKQAAQPASLILLDFMIPDRNGREIFLELRKRGDRTPVIFLSAQPDVEERTRDLDHSGVLGKPFQVDELLALIKKILSNSVDPAAQPAEADACASED